MTALVSLLFIAMIPIDFKILIFYTCCTYVQYSSQVTLPARTREYHKGAPRKVLMLRCPVQHLWVTVWITTSHASIFTRQQGSHEVQLAPRPAEHRSLPHTVAIYAQFSLG